MSIRCGSTDCDKDDERQPCEQGDRHHQDEVELYQGEEPIFIGLFFL